MQVEINFMYFVLKNSCFSTLLVVLLIILFFGNIIPIQGCENPKYIPQVTLLKPKGFSSTITDAQDIRQLHIFWNFRKPYNRSNPYSTTDFTNVSFNENFDRTITVADTEIQLRVGDSIFYWLLLVTREWERITLHKQNFWVRFSHDTWTSVPEPFAETYYRDFDNYYTKDEI